MYILLYSSCWRSSPYLLSNCKWYCYMADWFCALWLVSYRPVSSRTDLELCQNVKRFRFFPRINQQSHIINILLASFARSVQQVMDRCFFLPCFHHKRKEKTRSIACRTVPRTRPIRGIYYMADWFRVQWLVNSRPVSSRMDLLLSITFDHNLPYGPRTRLIRGYYYMADWFRVQWLVNSRPVSSRMDLLLSITFDHNLPYGPRTRLIRGYYYMADWFRELWLFNSRSVSCRTDL